MENNFKTKICGITRPEDATFALKQGTDYIGLINYQKSPRFINESRIKELIDDIPLGKRVYVNVSPSPEELQRILTLGFDYYQIHFNANTDIQVLKTWSSIVKPHQLWLAPRISKKDPFPEHLLKLTNTILLDSYNVNLYGGSGETGDWNNFRTLRKAYPQTQFILAGGLNTKNINNAVSLSGANFVDFNSGVEESPGIKDHQAIEELFSLISKFRKPH